MPRVPELVIGYDENSHPVAAACSACGEEMLQRDPRVTSGETIRWFSAQFKFHVECKHTEQEPESERVTLKPN